MSQDYTTVMTPEQFYNMFGWYPTKEKYDFHEVYFVPKMDLPRNE